jgi:hypothetical protein
MDYCCTTSSSLKEEEKEGQEKGQEVIFNYFVALK